MANIQGINIERGAQSTIKISSGVDIYIDPYKVTKGKADIILITHNHYDHCDPDSVNILKKENTVIIGPKSCCSKIDGIKTIMPGKTLEEMGIKIEAVDAYNINKEFHKKGECLGYIVTINGKRIYHAGDTDRINEMKKIKVDISFVPVGGTYTMTAEEAADAINNDIETKIAIPFHYGDVVGSGQDAEKFKSLCKIKVIII